MFEILKSYDFLVVALGTSFLALASAMVGCFSVYKGQSLIGDAIGHSAYPGVVFAFMCFQSRNPVILTLGAALFGALAYGAIQVMVHHSKIQLDAALAIVLTGFFGLGMVLKTYTQGNPLYANASQAGLKNYIFGLAAFLMKDDVKMIVVGSVVALLILWLFYKELSLSVFDPVYAQTLGISSTWMNSILLVMMIILIALGLKTVGAILISSFLVLPCLCASQWSSRLSHVLWIAAFVGMISSFVGTLLSSSYVGLSTGPTIILVMGSLTLISMFIGKRRKK